MSFLRQLMTAGDPADQWVTCTLGDLVALLTGHREGTR